MSFIANKNIAVLCNPVAGNGRAVACLEKIVAELSIKNISHTIFTNDWPKNFDGITDIFIIGGDGTLNYFINAYPLIKIPLVLFRGGTGNDFHWLLYGDKSMDERWQIALEGPARPIDVAKCNDRYFINGAGIGFEGSVVKTLTGKKKLAGKTSFLFTILQKIFTYRSQQYTIQLPAQIISGKKLMVDVSNGCRAGGGFYIAPVAKANDGLLDVIIVEALSPVMRLRYLPVIEKGKHLHLPFIQHFTTTNISIESNQPMKYHADGEYFEAKKITIEILPAALCFRY